MLSSIDPILLLLTYNYNTSSYSMLDGDILNDLNDL